MCERCRSLGLVQAEFATNEDRKAHQYACLDSEDGVCMNSTTRKKITGYTHHDEEGHYETVTVTEAYDEQKLVGYKCSSCGETK